VYVSKYKTYMKFHSLWYATSYMDFENNKQPIEKGKRYVDDSIHPTGQGCVACVRPDAEPAQ
jgi:hypothetical protein